jgi:hypothetical protein
MTNISGPASAMLPRVAAHEASLNVPQKPNPAKEEPTASVLQMTEDVYPPA